VPYRLLVQLASVVRDEGKRIDYVINKLKTYGTIKDKTDDLVRKITLAGNWVDDFGKVEKVQVDVNEAERKALLALIEAIKKENDANVIQTSIFEIARRNGLEPKQFFTILYRILVGAEKGPRLGPYIVDVGRENVAETLMQYCK
ncbi:MAG: lysine--tRNA ligase, partial [Nitrososphaerales archaeon]